MNELPTSSLGEDALASILLENVAIEDRSTVVLGIAKSLGNQQANRHGLAKARLVIALLKRLTKKEAGALTDLRDTRSALLSFVIGCFASTSPSDINTIRSVIEVCEYDEELFLSVLRLSLESVTDTVQNLLCDPEGYAVRPIGICEERGPIVGSAVDTAPATPSLDVRCAIACLKVVAYLRSLAPTMLMQIESALLNLVGASDKTLSASSKDALSTYLTKYDIPVSSGPAIERLWSGVESLTSYTTERQYATAGYQIWARASITRSRHLLGMVARQEEYWRWIQHGLLVGSNEQRKTCLFILQASLKALEEDVDNHYMVFSVTNRKSYLAAFARFSTVFDTIVLARYLNQVQACLPELFSLSRPISGVGQPWLLALLGAALEDGMQDSVRNVIGSWILEHGLLIVVGSFEAAPEFINKSLLPWASMAYHYSFLGRSSPRPPLCSHGDRLSGFLTDILCSETQSETQSESRHAIVKAALSYVASKGLRLFSFARAFILEGLAKSLGRIELTLDREEVGLVSEIASVISFQPIVRDLMTLQCGELLRLAPGNSDSVGRGTASIQHTLAMCDDIKRPLMQDESNADGRAAYEQLVSSTMEHTRQFESQSVPLHDPICIATFNHLLTSTNSKCLWHGGLQAGCTFVKYALENAYQQPFQAEDLEITFSALWEEYEVQEYPKKIAMQLPAIFLHHRSVRLCSADNCLTSLLTKFCTELQQLAETRIYLYSPLAEALYTVFTEVPEAVYLPFAFLYTRLADSPPTTRIEFELEAAVAPKLTAMAPHRTYYSYYGSIGALGHAYWFQTLNMLPLTPQWISGRRQLLHNLLEPWVTQTLPVPMSSKWKTSAQLQTMIIILEALSPGLSADEVDHYLKSYRSIIAIEPLPRFRYLLEWIVVRIYLHQPEARRREILQSLSAIDYYSNPKYLSSMLKLSLMLACLPDTTEAFALELMTQLIPLAASPKIVVRHEAQWTFPLLWSHAEQRGWGSMLENPAFAALNAQIRGLETYKTPPPGRIFEQFDPIKDHTMTNLLCGRYFEIMPPEAPKLSKSELFEVVRKYGDEAEDCGSLPLGLEATLTTPTSKEISSLPAPESGITQSTTSTIVPLQTKASTWQGSVADTIPSDLLEPMARGTRARDVVVVASLIQNAFNVGGLSRVGEIFGVKSLQVHDKGVISHKDFTSVSVSSHLWLPIEELKPEDIADFLIQKKLDGYTVIGIEQTDSSVVLGQGEWRFPNKVVLVLGSEREGIPATLLADMDTCVEIKQVGITRSMNVQTAAAVVLYEFARQHS